MSRSENWVDYRLNHIWKDIKRRCYNQNFKQYKDYGGRGIFVCDEWINSEKINGRTTKGWLAFKKWALSNGYQERLTIDRIDNSKGYSPDNCRWIDRNIQNNNTRRNRYITYNGKTQSMAIWAKELNIPYSALKHRLYNNWTIKDAFEVKVRNCHVRFIIYKGKSQSIIEWCKELGLKYTTILYRLDKLHYTVEEAFTK